MAAFQPLALHAMIEALFGARTTHRENPVTNSVGVAATQILQANPMRVGLVLFNLSGNGVYIAPNNAVSLTRGIYLAPNGGGASLVWDRDFELLAQEWWAIATAAASTVYILEIVNQ
jgi:hypothetical protein